VTQAPCSREASATQKPMPDVPPKIRILRLASLELYFWALADMVGGFLELELDR